jgi:hypothetical protein
MTWDRENRTATVTIEDAAPLRQEKREAKVQKERDIEAQAQLFVLAALRGREVSLTQLVKLARAEKQKGFPAAVERELFRLEKTGGAERISGPKEGTHLFRVRPAVTPSDSPSLKGQHQ